MPTARLLPIESVAAPASRWDRALEFGLYGLLAFAPLALGAVEAWSELVVVAMAALLSLGLALRAAFDKSFQPVWTWVYAPLGAFLLLGFVQLLPLGEASVDALSPSTNALRRELLSADYTPAAARTISLYPYATAHSVRLVLVGCAVLAVVVHVFRTPAAMKRLLGVMFALGCAEAALALLQIFTFADGIYWSLPAGRVTSGSFINYSNFSQFMNLSIGAGLGLLLVRIREDEPRDGHAVLGLTELRAHAGLLAALAVCAVSVFTSMSRNGMISLATAAAIVGTALFARGLLSRRGWLVAIIPMATLAVLLGTVFDAVYDRLATLEDDQSLAHRWELARGVLRAWQQFPLWGSGLGTHAIVFPLFDAACVAALAEHADNEYVQLLEESGVLGAAAAGAMFAMVVVMIVRLFRRGRTPISAAAFGLALGLIAVVIHSASDFGQRLPAVFCLTAAACGLLVQISRWERHAAGTDAHRGSEHSWPRLAAAAATAAVLAGIWYWALADAAAAFSGESWRGVALQVDERIRADLSRGVAEETLDEEFGDLLVASEHASASAPGNVHYAFWLNAYRWQAVHRSAAALPKDAALMALVERIADALADVRRICPTYGPAYALEGQLRLAVLGDSRGSELVRRGVRLAPHDPVACLTAGEIAAHEGRVDEAMELLSRAVALNRASFRDAAAALLVTLRRPDLAENLASGDPDRLQQLASLAATLEGQTALADRFRRAAETALRRKVADGTAVPRELAAVAALDAADERHDEAVGLYRRALASEYQRVDWRMALARSLAAVGRAEEAAREARICLRLKPGHAEARRLVESFEAEKPID
ncbi:MAG: hypothetical protein DCC67_13635 [Planctomycetota bacterium]|nr:MAG: hypothetical protein DCC67_13635 [Planctomycetota bacterium]